MYVVDNDGIDKEDTYPYIAKVNHIIIIINLCLYSET